MIWRVAGDVSQREPLHTESLVAGLAEDGFVSIFQIKRAPHNMQTDPHPSITTASSASVASSPDSPEPIATLPTLPMLPFVPIPTDQRIEALDVVRGFALIGIFMMNIEYFNRAMQAMGEGIPLTATGIDWIATWFVNYFVQGKFWTIFSLLFGMGFAVMMTRAERAGRPFLKPYLRRILALAVFGAVHFIFLWPGDILFSYAVAAGALLILMHGTWCYIVGAMVIAFGLGFLFDGFFAFVAGLAMVGLMALYMRNERLVSIRGLQLPIVAVVLLSIGILVSIAAIVFWALPHGPKEPRIPLSLIGPLVMVIGWLSARYHNPVSKRGVRLGVTAYLFMGSMMFVGGVSQYLAPVDPDVPAAIVAATATATAAATATTAATATAAAAATTTPATTANEIATLSASNAKDKTPETVSDAKVEKTSEKVAEKTSDIKSDIKSDSKPNSKSDSKSDKMSNTKSEKAAPEKTEAEKKAEKKAEKAKRLATQAEEKRNEERVFSQGTYLEGVEMRALEFPGKVAGDAGFATVLIGMFLLGVWFVRSGVMENTAGHLPFFRKLALIGIPLGVGLGLLGSLFAVSHVPGNTTDGFNLGRGIQTLGNLPACLGYVGLVVLMLHSKTVFAKISILAAPGRMALTNYLMQSLICALYFYGYGLGHWGMPRGQQLLFVVVVYSLQIALSHWWLARFKYGPMEWLWRGFTYRQMPKFAIDRAVAIPTSAAT